MGVGTLPELREAAKKRTELIKSFVNDGVKYDDTNGIEMKAEDLALVRKAKNELLEIKELIEISEMGVDIQVWMDKPAEKSLAQQIAAQVQQDYTSHELKSLGEAFLASDAFTKELDKHTGRSGLYEYKGLDIAANSGIETKADAGIFSGTPTGTGKPFGRVQVDPIVPRQYRAFRVRDLFPVIGTNATTIEYFRVTGFASGALSAAASVPDVTGAAGSRVFGVKPKSGLSFVAQNTTVKTIAHWEAAHRNALDDEPQLRGIIDTELLYGLRLEEDRQILSGSGNNDELLGILNTPGIQSFTHVAGYQTADALRKASTLVLVAEFEPTGFVLNPFDWEKTELQKAKGDGQYMLVNNVTVGAQQIVWRQPVVATVAMTQGTFLTGAFGLGAQLYDRQLANVRISDSHSDFFVRNAIVVLVEERLALAVKRPEAFVKGTFLAGDPDNDGTGA